MAISFLTGQRLTADLLNTNLYDYQPVTYQKTSVTTRTNTATLADDPDLSGIPIGVGTWEVEFVILWTQTSTAPRLKTRWAISGGGVWSGTGGIRASVGEGAAQTAGPGAVTDMTLQGFTLDTQDAVYGLSTGASFAVVRELSRNVVVTTAGTLSLQWAQSTATAAQSVAVQAASTVTLRKIST